ncbi:peptidase S16 [Azoarcus communis]|uniref:Peptidase S16 n=1 Tax=Parazoarcus communis SWub3 = DSM 12120 TaxID=1121029 RepID=A0A323UYK8_9RHOO|nr:LON peptidase substrate-binding domain-containing protein [Parazoarcus communis]NMG47853.1 peptidase S16 [Parazoarcus communis]NMG69610.1 peptidase S16 [Parazoarcus communis SWub3 = DSM 12120]PZA17545.1 peptidase S16 [Azoarcus communis] [Parazoarcus communis SWub3 = DSM 12120]
MNDTARLPLFPLNTVLFPDGLLPLRVFEARYMDMVTRCMREQSGFGVCLIAAGQEVGEAAVPHPVGTEARIEHWDMDEPGVLSIVVRGVRRFRILDHEVERDGLLNAEVQWLAEPDVCAVPDAQSDILPLLQQIALEVGDRMPLPHRFDNAAWVGARYAELLPIPMLARQRLLELDDVVSRLEIMQQYLRQHGLLAGH